MHKIFSVDTTPEENFKVHHRSFGFVFEKNSGREFNHVFIVPSSFSRSFVFTLFSVYTKTQNRCSQKFSMG